MDLGAAYRRFLLLYPREHQGLLGAEMAQTFDQAWGELRTGGALRERLRFVTAELIGLLAGAARAWLGEVVVGRGLPGQTALCRSSGENMPEDVIATEARVAGLLACTLRAIANHDFPGARSYDYQERLARAELRRLRLKYNIQEPGNGL